MKGDEKMDPDYRTLRTEAASWEERR